MKILSFHGNMTIIYRTNVAAGEHTLTNKQAYFRCNNTTTSSTQLQKLYSNERYEISTHQPSSFRLALANANHKIQRPTFFADFILLSQILFNFLIKLFVN